MTDFETVDIFTDESLVNDPFPYYEHLRAKCPVTDLPHHGAVAVTGYEEASELWRDADNYSSCIAVAGPLSGLPPVPEGVSVDEHIAAHRALLPMNEYLVTNDPPRHKELRAVLMRLLTPKRMEENEAAMADLVEARLDKVIPDGEMEVLNGFAQPFALLVIADLLGVPEQDHTKFTTRLGAENVGYMDEDEAVALDPLAFLFDYFASYIEARRADPRDDVLGKMAQVTYSDGSLPEVADVVHTATFLFAAGQDTTARLITAAMKEIGEDPELQARLRADRTLIPDFLEEVLRLEGPVKTVSRIARHDTTLGGVDIPAGTTLTVFPHAANRDPKRFENPNELEVDRPNSKEHLAFGRGAHSCPGGPLARVEARVAIDRILDRAADIRISEAHHGPAGDRRYQHEPTFILRGPRELHVEFTPVETS